MKRTHECPDCGSAASPSPGVSRRDFVKVVGATAVAASWPASVARLVADDQKKPQAETLVKKLYDSLTDAQKEDVWFEWDYTDDRGLLRNHVSNNWQITQPAISSDFFTKDQQEIIEAIFYDLYNPEWHDRINKQLQDDAGGYGRHQSIAIFGEPGTGKFEFVMTGRHLTIRCDGDSNEHRAFGGPIFYGHAAEGFNEKPDHPGNVFWPQALKANALYEMLDGKQRKLALLPQAPREREVHFRDSGAQYPGIPISELTSDQKSHVENVLSTLIEPYREVDRKEVVECLQAQGGLEKCSIAFYESGDLGNDGVWDNWRLEGPAFVWHYRGAPHVHVWVNVASDPTVKISTAG